MVAIITLRIEDASKETRKQREKDSNERYRDGCNEYKRVAMLSKNSGMRLVKDNTNITTLLTSSGISKNE